MHHFFFAMSFNKRQLMLETVINYNWHHNEAESIIKYFDIIVSKQINLFGTNFSGVIAHLFLHNKHE